MRKALSLTGLLVFIASGCSCGEEPVLTPTPTSNEPTSTSPMPTASPIRPPLSPIRTPEAEMTISSPAFATGEAIPEAYSCFGENLSPPLQWSGVPPQAQSLLLLVYDPDAGAGAGASTSLGFVHWAVFNIPPTTGGYPEGMPGGVLDDGALQGTNDFEPFSRPGGLFPGGAPVRVVGYDGPCPGSEHRYVFALYALDTLLDLEAGTAVSQILEAMEGHVLAQAETMGVYAPK